MSTCETIGHSWVFCGTGTHFVDEPNSSRRSRPVHKVRCPVCDQRGYRYPPSLVVYTWRTEESET